jgi:hypothetical protein
MTYLRGECSCICEDSARFNIGGVLVLNDPPTGRGDGSRRHGRVGLDVSGRNVLGQDVLLAAGPSRRVVQNNHSAGIQAGLTTRVNAHMDTRIQLVVSTSVECVLSMPPLPGEPLIEVARVRGPQELVEHPPPLVGPRAPADRPGVRIIEDNKSPEIGARLSGYLQGDCSYRGAEYTAEEEEEEAQRQSSAGSDNPPAR